MLTPQLVDALLTPIGEASPCGDDLEYDADFMALTTAAQGKAEQQFGDTVIPAVEPDWRDVAERADAQLRRSKDVRAAVLLLRPGESKKLDLTLPADAKAIGVMAAFRDLDRARWREVRAVTPGQAQVLNVTFGARQIRVDAAK